MVETGGANKQQCVNNCLDMLRTTLRDLYAGKMPLQQLGITKSLKDNYKSEPPHLRVAERMRARGEEVRSNDRITYIVLVDRDAAFKRKSAAAKISDRAEDINWLIKNPKYQQFVDYDYYAESQLSQPITQLLNLLMPEQQILNVMQEEKRNKERAKNALAKRTFFQRFNQQPKAEQNEDAKEEARAKKL
jgi:DNA polymerase elongation subunit (family B)